MGCRESRPPREISNGSGSSVWGAVRRLCLFTTPPQVSEQANESPCIEQRLQPSPQIQKIHLKCQKVKNFKIGVYKVRYLMIEYHLSSGSGGMADALDSGSSGSLSCESSSLFFRIDWKVEKSLCIKASPLFLLNCFRFDFGYLWLPDPCYMDLQKL